MQFHKPSGRVVNPLAFAIALTFPSTAAIAQSPKTDQRNPDSSIASKLLPGTNLPLGKSDEQSSSLSDNLKFPLGTSSEDLRSKRSPPGSVTYSGPTIGSSPQSYISAAPPPSSLDPGPWGMFGLYAALGVGLVGLSFYLNKRALQRYGGSARENQPQRSQKMDFSGNHFDLSNLPTLRLGDVGGIGEARDEVSEQLDLMRRYIAGEDVEIDRCIFFSGPPGVGKTRLARAMAGELGVPFTEFNATDWTTQIYVGDALKRINESVSAELKKSVSFQNHLRKQQGATGKERGVVLIFVDELDSIAQARGKGNNNEDEKVTNKILEIADGSSSEYAGLIIIAATNRPELLDEAAKRSGRFHQIPIQAPRLASQRKEVIEALVPEKVAAFGYTVADEAVDWLANVGGGKSGADFAKILTHAKRLAEQDEVKNISLGHLSEAFFRVSEGRIKKDPPPRAEQIATMEHELGHAVMSHLVGATIEYISGMPRSKRLGCVGISTPEAWEYHQSYETLMGMNLLYLGGRAAEIICKGHGGVSMGAGKDYEFTRGLLQELLGNSLLGDVHDFGPGVETGSALQPHHRERINTALRALEFAAHEILSSLGKEWFELHATECVDAQKELVGQDARNYTKGIIGDEKEAELLALLRTHLNSFTYSEFGPGWRERSPVKAVE